MAGRGSLEKRGKNTWRLVVFVARDADRKQIKHSKTFHGGSRQAESALAKFVADIERGEYVKRDKMYTKDYLEQWYKDYALVKTAVQTHERYEQLLRKYAYNTIGKHQLEQLNPRHFEKLYQEMQTPGVYTAKGLSGTTTLQLHRILHKAFVTAVKWGIMSKNPMAGVDAPRKTDTEVDVYDEVQAIVMLQKAYENEPYWFYVLSALAVTSGLRRGELLGLRWQDLDFDNNTLSVKQSLQRKKGEGVSPKDPKTKKSKRTIAMPGDIMELLKKHKAKQTKYRLSVVNKWKDHDLVFPGDFGKPMSIDHVSHLFTEFIRTHKLPHVTLHGLRHTAASILINKGVHAKGISSRLGHSGIQITMNTYGKFFESADREAGDKMAGMIPLQTQIENRG